MLAWGSADVCQEAHVMVGLVRGVVMFPSFPSPRARKVALRPTQPSPSPSAPPGFGWAVWNISGWG